MMTFFSRLESRVHSVDSLLCIGLDPHKGDLPVFTGQAAKTFCLRLIHETMDVAAAYKPNSAFFEALGPEGISMLSEVIAAVPDEIPVILDSKRGDISSTARAYSQAVFDILGADAVTINPYLGYDALEPFLLDPDKGVFLLCKTSNPGAAELQDLQVIPPLMAAELGNRTNRDLPTIPLYMQVARLAQKWNTRDNLGLVVGATQPESLERIRVAAPEVWILAPGVGAQGGDLRAALSSGLRADGLGMLLPVSRGISRSDNPAEAAKKIRDAINRERCEFLKSFLSSPVESRQADSDALSPKLAHIADGLLDAGCIKFGSFTLKSGTESPIYIDLRRLAGFPQLLIEVAGAYIDILRDLKFDHLGALPYAALPIATAISLEGNWSMIYTRKEVKSYGTGAQIEGVYQSGQRVVVIDDLISTGGSKFEGIEKFESEGLTVADVVVLIDRSVDGGEDMNRRGYSLHAALTLSQILSHYERTVAVGKDEIDATRDFLLRKGSS
jgi:uridine monophosphate synthetase